MVLAMSRPWKHPKTGIYWLRKGVPDDLRAAVGKREEKFSLKTRNPDEAKRLHAQALIEIEQRWSNLRAPVRKLDNSELYRISIGIYEHCLNLGGCQASIGTLKLASICGREMPQITANSALGNP
jgi:hypothetical protein